jgi:hypothetical protein
MVRKLSVVAVLALLLCISFGLGFAQAACVNKCDNCSMVFIDTGHFQFFSLDGSRVEERCFTAPFNVLSGGGTCNPPSDGAQIRMYPSNCNGMCPNRGESGGPCFIWDPNYITVFRYRCTGS